MVHCQLICPVPLCTQSLFCTIPYCCVLQHLHTPETYHIVFHQYTHTILYFTNTHRLMCLVWWQWMGSHCQLVMVTSQQPWMYKDVCVWVCECGGYLCVWVFVCVGICVCGYLCVRECGCICVDVWMNGCVDVFLYVYVCVFVLYLCMYICMYVCVCLYMCVYFCVRGYVNMWICGCVCVDDMYRCVLYCIPTSLVLPHSFPHHTFHSPPQRTPPHPTLTPCSHRPPSGGAHT